MIKPVLSKLNFAIGRNPVTEKTENFRNFIPEPFKAVVLISADFELSWAWQFAKHTKYPLEKALKNARQERENVPVFLGLCEQYNIPITWATVGHLFLESCKRSNGLAHPELLRLNNLENEFWLFGGKDWFENDPCTDFLTSPEWYCPDLIQLILKSKVKHEIGSHTFSHIDCRDIVCSVNVFDSEITACKIEAEKLGIQLKTFVHPAHTIGNIERLSYHGFTSFRTDYKNALGYPFRHPSGIWEIKNTAALYYRKEWTLKYHIYRYKKIIDRAIRSNTVCCFWFHPSVEAFFIDEVFKELFDYLNRNRSDVWISTTADYIDWLNSKSAL